MIPYISCVPVFSSRCNGDVDSVPSQIVPKDDPNFVGERCYARDYRTMRNQQYFLPIKTTELTEPLLETRSTNQSSSVVPTAIRR